MTFLVKQLKTMYQSFSDLVPSIKVLLVGAFIILGMMIVHDFKTKTKLDQQIESMKQHQKNADKALALVDSLNKVVAQKTTEITKISKQFNELQKKSEEQSKIISAQMDTATVYSLLLKNAVTDRDSLNAMIKIIPSQKAIIDSQIALIKVKDTQISLLTISNQKKDSIIALLKQSQDTLHTTVITTPTDISNPDKFFGFIPKPTRTQSFISGLIAGVILTVKLIK